MKAHRHYLKLRRYIGAGVTLETDFFYGGEYLIRVLSTKDGGEPEFDPYVIHRHTQFEKHIALWEFLIRQHGSIVRKLAPMT